MESTLKVKTTLSLQTILADYRLGGDEARQMAVARLGREDVRELRT
ncbi:MAG: hypothetical protein NTV01_00790 [Bacteroidia bacterium]|nr:hypothetical protein [Bacteroidia bacterium]